MKRRMRHPHHIGGSISQIQRRPYLERVRRKGKRIVFKPSPDRWKLQCYCGNVREFYKYRGRYYCGFCGWHYSRGLKVLKDGVYVELIQENIK